MSFDTDFDAAVDAPPKHPADEATALLIRARGLLERGWCRGAQALDADGEPVWGDSDRAVVWCAYGALCAAGMPLGAHNHPAVHRLTGGRDGFFLADFNNAQETVEPVLAAFDRAIATGGQ